MATNPTDILRLPKSAWAADDVAMLYDTAHHFMSEEILPHCEAFEKNEMVDRASWERRALQACSALLYRKSKAVRVAPSPMRARPPRRPAS